MPSDSTPAAKRRVKAAAAEAPQGDHRKRRRNRTTQSCLNCHATKRMCDRKRPCSRCIQLGLTGLCVYEVDDPARKSTTTEDETTRLQNRIAELEGVIRELKNKPHPRWTAADAHESSNNGFGFLHTPPRSPASSSSNLALKLPAYVSPDASLPTFGDLRWTDLLNWESSQSSDSSYSRSPLSTPSPLVSASRSPEFLPPTATATCHESPWLPDARGPHKAPLTACSCLNEPICYNTTVELASELRRASAAMSRSLNHCFGAPCALSTKIRELETLAVNALRDTRLCPNSLPAPIYRLPDVRANQQQLKLAAQSPLWDENGLPAYDDSFMAWIPHVGASLKIYP
ncbi:hypothetical protein C8F04DRAFT_440728 [Mycena alexandri]|uniref:Zn(2)-C6 fungal-type domain-containing protein n=1 Tax=Mycena alexandri TaxID=1745969 RepID=A0AAD6XD42_9AGAR|nr:hypothetical protein C8F04DRAFT_440728 [Mycena alexandri]